MTKQIFNKTTAGVLAVVIATVIAGFGDQATANAQTATSTRVKANPFCNTVLPRLTTKMQERFTKQSERLATKETFMLTEIQDTSSRRNARLSMLQTEQQSFRKTQYDKLRTNAKTDAEKQAVEKFITTVDGALNTRQNVISSATESYQSSKTTIYQSKMVIVNDALAKYRSTANNALTNAKNQCKSGMDGTAVKTELKTALKSGQEQLKADLKNLERVRNDYKNARQSLKTLTNDAIKNFTTAVVAAREELKKALGSSIPE